MQQWITRGNRVMDSLQTVFKAYMGGENGEEEEPFLYGDNLFIIIDGPGGDPDLAGPEDRFAGLEARACRIIFRSFFDRISKVDSPADALLYALQEANRHILDESKQLGRKVIFSVGVMYIKNKIMFFTHLGDSRIYCYHGGELNQLTRDHTFLENDPLAKSGFHDPHGNTALTEGLGIHRDLEIEVKKYPLKRKDLIVMTTEGFTKRISDRDIRHLSLKTTKPDKLCDRLFDLVERKGGSTRMTLGLVRYGILPRDIRNIIILYSSLLITLSIVGGYALKYTGKWGGNEVKETPARQGKITDDGKPAVSPSRRAGDDKRNRTGEVLPAMQPTAKPTVQPTAEPPLQPQLPSIKDIHLFINDWKQAWENTAGTGGDIDRYISFYSKDFTSKGLDRNGWKRDKAVKGKKKRWIRVDLNNIKISRPGEANRIEVRFMQDYRSSNYLNSSAKLLLLIRENSGWKIVAEKSD